jgi:hypothetical protein
LGLSNPGATDVSSHFPKISLLSLSLTSAPTIALKEPSSKNKPIARIIRNLMALSSDMLSF